jgi:hypothetical protein
MLRKTLISNIIKYTALELLQLPQNYHHRRVIQKKKIKDNNLGLFKDCPVKPLLGYDPELDRKVLQCREELSDQK